MSDQTSKVFTLDLSMDTKDAEKNLKAFEQISKEFGDKFSVIFEQINLKTNKTKASVQVITGAWKDAKQTLDAYNSALSGQSLAKIDIQNGSLVSSIRSIRENIAEARRLARERAADEKELDRQIAEEERKLYEDKARFYHNWISEVHALEQVEIAEVQRKNARIRADTTAMYRTMFDEIQVMQKRSLETSFNPPKPVTSNGYNGYGNLGGGRDNSSDGPSQYKTRFNYTTGAAVAIPDKVIDSHKTLFQRVAEINLEYRALNASINLTQQALLSIPKAGIAYEGALASLTATFGSLAGAHRELAFLTAEAARTGIPLGELRHSYANVAASFILAGESAETTRRIFANVNTVSTTLHKTTDEVSGVFLALSQMFNKGHIQAEELVKQLAQQIPGIYEQTALALGKTTSQLQTEMKKGLIEAHGNVDEVFKVLATTFGGSAFKAASSGMNSEIGRVQTSWRLLSENVYKASSEILISTLRMTSGGISGFASFAENTEKVKTTVASFITTVGGIAVGMAAAKVATIGWTGVMAAATKGTTGLTAAVTGLQTILSRNIFSLVIIGATTFIAKMIEAKTTAEDLHAEAERLRNGDTVPEAKKKTVAYRVEQDPRVITAQAKLDQASDSAKGAFTREELEKRQLDIRTFYKELNKTKSTVEAELRKSDKETGGKINNNKEDLTEIFSKIDAEYEGVTEGKIAGARAKAAYRYRKEIAKLQKEYATGNLDAGDYLKKIQENINAAGDKAGAPDHAKDVKAQLTDFQTAIIDNREKIADQLILLGNSFKDNGKTISEYFAEKRRLQREDIALQNKAVDNQLGSAFAEKDVTKIAELQKEKRKIAKDAAREETALLVEQDKAGRDFQKTLADISIEYTKLTQGKEESAIAKWRESKKSELEQIAKETQSPDNRTAALTAQTQVGLLEEQIKFQGELNDLTARFSNIQNQLAGEEEQINKDRQNGFKSEFEAMIELGRARTTALDQESSLMTDVNKLSSGHKDLLAMPGMSSEVKKIQDMQNAVHNLGAEANVVGEKFKSIFTTNMTDSLVAFATGSATAENAFRGFAAGVLNNLAQMAAAEASNQMLKAIIGTGISSGISGLFGNAIPTAAANSPSFTDMMNNPNFWTKSSKGNIFDGGIKQQFATGGIPDIGSNYATFPMGSLREKGPEAILPLQRDSYGNLGVNVASGNGKQSGGNVYQINANVSHSGNESPDALGRKIAESAMRTIARQELTNAMRPGNQLNRVTNFGAN